MYGIFFIKDRSDINHEMIKSPQSSNYNLVVPNEENNISIRLNYTSN